jgi:hypothetical protein
LSSYKLEVPVTEKLSPDDDLTENVKLVELSNASAIEVKLSEAFLPISCSVDVGVVIGCFIHVSKVKLEPAEKSYAAILGAFILSDVPLNSCPPDTLPVIGVGASVLVALLTLMES